MRKKDVIRTRPDSDGQGRDGVFNVHRQPSGPFLLLFSLLRALRLVFFVSSASHGPVCQFPWHTLYPKVPKPPPPRALRQDLTPSGVFWRESVKW